MGKIAGRFDHRLNRTSATVVSLDAYKGLYAEVNGELLSFSGRSLSNTDNLITASGGDAGAAMAANTFYYVYVSNSVASTFPNSLRASTSLPTSWNGVKYLAVSGNGRNWRLAGILRTNASTQFDDDVTNRRVGSWYNRRPKDILIVPGYVNDGSSTSYTNATLTYAQANGGTGSTASFVSNGEDAVVYSFAAAALNSLNDHHRIGIGHDSTTTAYATGRQGGNAMQSMGGSVALVFAEGYHTLDILVMTDSGTTTFQADLAPAGGATDPRSTYLTATVML